MDNGFENERGKDKRKGCAVVLGVVFMVLSGDVYSKWSWFGNFVI